MSEHWDTEEGEGVKHCSTPPTHATSMLAGESELSLLPPMRRKIFLMTHKD